MASSVLASRPSVAANGRPTEIILTSTWRVNEQLEAYLVTASRQAQRRETTTS
jgi:hypothetical protein